MRLSQFTFREDRRHTFEGLLRFFETVGVPSSIVVDNVRALALLARKGYSPDLPGRSTR